MSKDRSEYNREYNKRKWAENKEQDSARHAEWRKANREKRNAYARVWWAEAKAKDPDKYFQMGRRARLKRRYGISLEDYEQLLVKQGGHCALCDRTPDLERNGCFHVDHCHETNKVRGLLCEKHNHALGKLGDNEASILKLLAYLRGI